MAIEQMEQEFPTKIFPEENAVFIEVRKPFYPMAMRVEKEGLVFVDVTGERSKPILIPKHVEAVGIILAWRDPNSISDVDVASEKWVGVSGIEWDPVPPKGIKVAIRESFPHTPSYLGGNGADMIRTISTVFREGDLPFRRAVHGTLTASGLLLQGSKEIELDERFQIHNLETGEIIVMDPIA